MDIAGIKKRLADGAYLYGPFVRIADPVVTEILGYAGFDFVILDMEHGPMGVHQAENLVRAAKLAGAAPLIRVRENNETMIVRALDTGSAGVQIPQVNSRQAAEAAVAAAKFSPRGHRGVCRFTRNAEYSNVPVPDYFRRANEESLIVVQIEGAGGVNDIDAILDVPGIDVLFLGPYDLSQALGHTGEVTHPRVLEVIRTITQKSRDKGVAVGSFANDRETLLVHKSFGIQYLSYGIDTGILYEAVKDRVNALLMAAEG